VQLCLANGPVSHARVNQSGKCGFASRQAIKFGAYVSHATGYDHATNAGACLPGFHHADYAQRFAYYA